MTKEEALAPHVKMSNASTFWLYAEDAKSAMDEYAKQQAIAFDVWKRVNLYTLDYPNNRYIKLIVSDGKARTEMVPVDDVYSQFIEQ